nr:hypothetical protein B0A51_13036 [Rachicladosporium sp. CCFEE 5018]
MNVLVGATHSCVRFDTPATGVGFTWIPHHDIQDSRDFGFCSLRLYADDDCRRESRVISNIASHGKETYWGGQFEAYVRSAKLECEREWVATECEKANGMKERMQNSCGLGTACKRA